MAELPASEQPGLPVSERQEQPVSEQFSRQGAEFSQCGHRPRPVRLQELPPERLPGLLRELPDG
jgi:hypothetical protein